MGTQFSRTVLAGLVALGLPVGVARAADGDLDPTFGNGGKVVTNFNLPASAASAVAIQGDGKIVAAGFSFDEQANIDFAAARYDTQGNLDPTFNSDGRVTTDFFGFFDIANAVAIQPDGKIVLAGTALLGLVYDFALVRYNPDGSLDSSFDGDGKLTTDFDGGGDSAYGVVIQPDGKIIAVGVSNRPHIGGRRSRSLQHATEPWTRLSGSGAESSRTLSGGGGGGLWCRASAGRQNSSLPGSPSERIRRGRRWLILRYDSNGMPRSDFRIERGRPHRRFWSAAVRGARARRQDRRRRSGE